jgi:transposase-like protein
MSVLSQPQFHDEATAFDYVEAALWPTGPICPHCGGFDRISVIKANPAKKIRLGLKYCGQCRKQFTVRIGTIFEESHLPMTKWLQAIFLMSSSKKGVSSHQLHRTLECTYKTAWFLSHRIREAMRSGELAPFGSGGGAVEVDETYIGLREGARKGRSGAWHKNAVLSLIDRDTGAARSVVLTDFVLNEVAPILEANIAREARLMTDEALVYRTLGWNFAQHGTVNHSKDEYVSRADPTIHTNTVEGFYSIFKRGMRGVYQHCSAKHLHRYVAEFDFRYSNRVALGVDDMERSDAALRGMTGRRLTYRATGGREASASL